jgi:hypothetical protein
MVDFTANEDLALHLFRRAKHSKNFLFSKISEFFTEYHEVKTSHRVAFWRGLPLFP